MYDNALPTQINILHRELMQLAVIIGFVVVLFRYFAMGKGVFFNFVFLFSNSTSKRYGLVGGSSIEIILLGFPNRKMCS